jgi:hypothetical protein
MSEITLAFLLLILALFLCAYRIEDRIYRLHKRVDSLFIEVVKLSGDEERVRYFTEPERKQKWSEGWSWSGVIGSLIGWSFVVVIVLGMIVILISNQK